MGSSDADRVKLHFEVADRQTGRSSEVPASQVMGTCREKTPG